MTDGIKVLVCGGRDYRDRRRVFEVLDGLVMDLARPPVSTIIQGEARGADTLGKVWARSRRVRVESYAADWETHGRAAGPIRNKRMLDEGRPDLVVAFPGGRGTANMVEQARAAGVEVVVAEP